MEIARPPKNVCPIPDKCLKVICWGPEEVVLMFRYLMSMLTEAQY